MNEYSLREDCILNKMIYNCIYNNTIISSTVNAFYWHSLLVVVNNSKWMNE